MMFALIAVLYYFTYFEYLLQQSSRWKGKLETSPNTIADDDIVFF